MRQGRGIPTETNPNGGAMVREPGALKSFAQAEYFSAPEGLSCHSYREKDEGRAP